MVLRSRILGLVGVGILGLGAVSCSQVSKTSVPMTSHTVIGKITSLEILPNGTSYAAVACDQIKVKAEIWSDIDKVNTGKEVFASTMAKGNKVEDGCTYSLTFDYDPSRQLPEFSEYRISAEAPQIREGETAGYTAKVEPPFADQVDMQI